MSNPKKRNKIDHWGNFINKLSEYQETDINYWNEYDLLGYWCDLTRMPVDDDGYTPPSRHKQLKKMRIITWTICHPSAKTSTHSAPDYLDVQLVKDFLDWTWDQMQKKDIPCHSLSYVIGEQMEWVQQWRATRCKTMVDFDPSKLDVGDLL